MSIWIPQRNESGLIINWPQFRKDVNFSWRANPFQRPLYDSVKRACRDTKSPRIIGGFGAIRSGKTSAILKLIHLLARKYPKSRWHCIRATEEEITETTIPSFKKVTEGSNRIRRWYESPGRQRVFYKNGSAVFFVSSKESKDVKKEFKWMLGLETNGIFLEQLEGLNEKLWTMAGSRTGSWYIDPMPPAFIFFTVNPCQSWPKKTIYNPWRKRTLDKGIVAIEIPDSPFITDQQRENWKSMMDDVSYNQFIKGDWDAIPNLNQWAYKFDKVNHVSPIEMSVMHDEPIYLSFDFNRVPMTCVVEQHGYDWSYIPEVISLGSKENGSDIWELCAIINGKFGHIRHMINVTGDASGSNKSAMAKRGENDFYMIIQDELRLNSNQIQVPSHNMLHRKSRPTCNGFLQHMKKIQICPVNAKTLISDFLQVESTPDGSIDKANLELTHALDAWRYMVHTYHPRWLIG